MSKKKSSSPGRSPSSLDTGPNPDIYWDKLYDVQKQIGKLEVKIAENTTTLKNIREARTDSFRDDRLKYAKWALYLSVASILLVITNIFGGSILALLFPTP